MKLQNWVLELWSNYRTATDSFFNLSPPCTLLMAGTYTGATTWPATRRALLAPHLPQHELPQPVSPWLRIELPLTIPLPSLTPSVPGDGKPPRERPNGPTRPWFHSKPHRPGSSSACHAPMVTWAAATTPAMRHAAQTASPLAVACLCPLPGQIDLPQTLCASPQSLACL